MKALNKFISAIALSMLFAGAVQAQAPANDDCAGAITVTCGQTVTGSTLNANIDAAPACVTTVTQGYGVWYRFVGTGQTVTLSTCNATTNYDSQIAVFSGSCTALACVTANDNDAACGRKSTVSFNSSNGTTYYIWVTGVVGSRGNFALSVACSGGVTAPANDLCANAATIACGGVVTGTTTGATVDAVGTCTTSLGTAPGVWYRLTGNGGTVTASLCGSAYDTKIGVFTGSCGALTCVIGNDDFCSLQSQVSFSSTNGTTYYILVTGFSTAAGSFSLAVTCTSPPPPTDNNACSAATPIACGGTASGTTATATVDGPSASCTGGSVAADRWYSIVGTGFSMTATTCTGTAYDSKLDIYTGSCGALTSVACNDDACGLQSTVTWATTSGTTYLIRVHGFSGATGAYTLGVTCATSLAENNDINAVAPVLFGQTGKQGVGEFTPNPAQFGNTLVKVYAQQESQATVVLFDNMGRLVLNRQVDLFEGENPIELSVADLPVGTYFASITMNGEVFRRKLVIAQ